MRIDFRKWLFDDLFPSIYSRYDFNERRWTILEKMTTKRVQFSMVVADRFIYALGGKLGNQCLNAVDVYDPVNNHWRSGHPMTMPRAYAGVVLYKECIYAIGGETDGIFDTPTVERYDGNEWKMVNVETKVRKNRLN